MVFVKKDEVMKDLEKEGFGIITFDDLLTQHKISEDAEIVPLLKELWNAGVKAASDYFGHWEGTDYGAENALTIK